MGAARWDGVMVCWGGGVASVRDMDANFSSFVFEDSLYFSAFLHFFPCRRSRSPGALVRLASV